MQGCDVGQGGARCCGTAAEVVFHVHEVSAFGADLLFSMPVCAIFNGV